MHFTVYSCSTQYSTIRSNNLFGLKLWNAETAQLKQFEGQGEHQAAHGTETKSEIAGCDVM